MNKTEIAVSIFDRHANLYQEKFMNVDLYGESLDLFCKHVKTNGDVLELACGPGNVTKYILNKRSDLKILGTDLSENMLELARENNPSAVFTKMDCRDISKLSKTYDAIICAFALPYLSKEEAITLINDASKRLNKDGLLYISTMEDDYSKSGPATSSQGDLLFIHYHEQGYLTKSLENSGFEVIHLNRKQYAGPDGKPVTDLLILTKLRGKPL
ncbi:MAG: methyltransferase domain-containing protein [Sphingobacteriaceae bacterium]|nr:methyltransferase domain-containing protein [Sphingobacteriaceae bacterium]